VLLACRSAWRSRRLILSAKEALAARAGDPWQLGELLPGDNSTEGAVVSLAPSRWFIIASCSCSSVTCCSMCCVWVLEQPCMAARHQ
jgi:hypothetical protein